MEAGVPQGAPDSPDMFNISTLPFNFDFREICNFSYCPWYCDDQLQIVASPSWRKGTHEHYLKKAISVQNEFEKTRGIITCAEKSMITPITTDLNPITIVEDQTILRYDVLARGATTKILGLNITRTSFTARHADLCAERASAIISAMYCLQGLDFKGKIHLVKALIVPLINYPAAPLNSISLTGVLQLQSILNKGLNFVYKNRWPNLRTAKSLHERARIIPINQTIHHRAVKIWDKIEAHTAADEAVVDKILNLPLVHPHCHFPSSYVRARKDEPPPLYTHGDRHNPGIAQYYQE